jgi:hypothetical protein
MNIESSRKTLPESLPELSQVKLELSMPGHHRLLSLESKQATSDNLVVNQPHDPREKRTKNRYSKQ